MVKVDRYGIEGCKFESQIGQLMTEKLPFSEWLPFKRIYFLLLTVFFTFQGDINFVFTVFFA